VSFILIVSVNWKSEVIILVAYVQVNVESVPDKFFPVLNVVWYV